MSGIKRKFREQITMSYITESAYRYSIYKGKLLSMHGQIVRTGSDIVWFVPDDDGQRRRAPETEGEVMHNSVWLIEDDLVRAKSVLLDHMSKQYDMHLKKAAQYYDTMQYLLSDQNN